MTVLSSYNLKADRVCELPSGVNVKLLFRHSHRPSLLGVEFPDEVGLTKEGYNDAISFGKKLSSFIGNAYCSPVKRCRETIEAILEDKNYFISSNLGYSFVNNCNLAKLSFEKFNLKQIVFKLTKGERLAGFIDIHEGIGILLDFIFSTGNKRDCLDLYCTHDFTIALLITSVFYGEPDLGLITEQWPKTLEGVWLWGSRNDFYIVWRGNKKHLINFVPTEL